MKKVLAIVLSVAMLLSVLSVNIFAEDDVLFDLSQYKSEIADYEAGKVAEGWCPSAITEWNGQQDTMAAFVEALRTEGAYIEVITKPNSDGGNVNGLLLMSYPLGDGDNYTSTIFSTKLADTYEIEDGKTVTTFDAAAAVAQYESTPHGDDATGATMCSLDKLMTFGIDIPSGAMIYNVMVKVAPSTPKVSINKEKFFDTLVEAVEAAEDGDTIYLHESMEGAGIGIFAPDVKDITIDFGGNTYTCVGPAVGSTGTQSQAFHLEKSADYTPNVTFKNGTITAETGKNVKMLIQNYCNLTLTDMNLIGTTDTQYVLSNNFGNTVIDGNTSITATAGNVAFDVCYANGPYKDGVSVTVNTTGTITGIIELGTWNAAGAATGAPDINDYLDKAKLIINNVELQGEIINNVGGFNDYEPDNAGGTDEENKAEYNEKLQKAIDINGGTFAAGSKVENYLPEGGYKTDAAGNIIVGKKNDSNRITGCVYLNEDYHALIVNGRFIAQPHVDNGSGFCTACKGVIVADTAE